MSFDIFNLCYIEIFHVFTYSEADLASFASKHTDIVQSYMYYFLSVS